MTTQTPAKTQLGELAALLLEVQRDNMAPMQGPLGMGPQALTDRQLSLNDKLGNARILVDVLRGDGQ